MKYVSVAFVAVALSGSIARAQPAPASEVQTLGLQTPSVAPNAAPSGPDEIDNVQDGRGAPVGYTEARRRRKGLLLTGAITLAASYSISALVAAVGDGLLDSGPGWGLRPAFNDENANALLIPIAGPIIQLGHGTRAPETVFLVGDCAVQVAGAVMLFAGASSTKRVFVRNDLVSNVVISPMVGVNGATGLSLAGAW